MTRLLPTPLPPSEAAKTPAEVDAALAAAREALNNASARAPHSRMSRRTSGIMTASTSW